jgi:AcrR family transcriptional regulator
MSKRRYRQQVRAEAAEETRQRVLDALYELLRDQPAEPVSVEEIAQHARVSRSTV